MRTVLAVAGLFDGFDADDVMYLSGLIVAVAAACAVLYRTARSILRCIHQVSADTAAVRLALYPERGPSLVEQVAELRRELKPNGGQSLRDQTTRIETRQLELRTQMTGLSDDVREVRAETARQGDRIDRHIDKHGGP